MVCLWWKHTELQEGNILLTCFLFMKSQKHKDCTKAGKGFLTVCGFRYIFQKMTNKFPGKKRIDLLTVAAPVGLSAAHSTSSSVTVKTVAGLPFQ